MKELAPFITQLDELSDGQLRYLLQAIQQILNQRALAADSVSTLEQLYEQNQLPGESFEQFLLRIAPPVGSGFWS